MRVKFAPMVTMAFCCALALAGCSGGSSKPSLPVIGIADSESAQQVEVTNGLAEAVEDVCIRATGSETWPQSLSMEESLDPEETQVLSVDEAAGAQVDIKLVGASGTAYEFLQLPLAEMASLTFRYEDEVAYVEYTDKDGKQASTKDAALTRKAEEEAAKKAEEEAAKKAEEEAAKKAEEEAAKKAEEEAAKKAEEEAAKKAEEEAAAQATEEAAPAAEETWQSYEEPVYEEPVYEEPAYEEPVYEEPVYEEPAPSQSEDQCLDDPVFFD